jgi:DNA-binding XRE family transcriptional regulator
MTAKWVAASTWFEREVEAEPDALSRLLALPEVEVKAPGRDLIREAYDEGKQDGVAAERARWTQRGTVSPPPPLTPTTLQRPPELQTFGELLRCYRQRRGLTQTQLARAAGCDVSYLTRVERDERAAPRRSIVDALIDYLELTPFERRRFLVATGYAPVLEWTAAMEEAAVEEDHS